MRAVAGTPAATAPGPGVGPEPSLRRLLERGRRVFTGCVALVLLGGVLFALAASALTPSPTAAWPLAGAVLVAVLLALVLGHLLARLPVAVPLWASLLTCVALPALVAQGSPEQLEGSLRVLPTPASATLWLVAGTRGPVGRVLVRAAAAGALGLGLASASAALAGVGALDLVGPAVTALLAVGTLVVAERSAAQAEQAVQLRRAASVDLQVARRAAAARRRLDARLHDVVLGALAALVDADAARAPAVRELAAEALAHLVESEPAGSRARGTGPVPGSPVPGVPVPGPPVPGSSVPGPPVVGTGPGAGLAPTGADPACELREGLRRLATRIGGEGVRVELRRAAARSRAVDAGPTVEAVAVLGAHQLEALLGAAGEALRNVVRHARTDSALVVWSLGPDGARVLVVDAGAGFDPQAVAPSSFGLERSVHERLAEVGGTSYLRSRPGRGTLLALSVPGSGSGTGAVPGARTGAGTA
ncbi:sensor histidine kinase [Pseudokineococcus sp. 1T1Z-3]|uniref:sensor histidine kinase n=1 Tax=Pseudokineococcus sp. 1T1Z-3 TaxID=3132745 RepID=UPI0030B06E43